MWIPVNPLIESQWSIVFTALDWQKLKLQRSAHVSLLNEILPYPGAPSVSPVSVLLPLHHPHSLTLDFYWPTATFNYHEWKEKQIRRAWSSETDSTSLTIQKENNCHEHSLRRSVKVLNHMCVVRGITKEHRVFWMQDKHQVYKI